MIRTVSTGLSLYHYLKAMMAMAEFYFLPSVLADFLVPGDLLKKITENSIASAIYTWSAIIRSCHCYVDY